ncbi:MAG: prephenate dehydrogenase [Propionibacteriales bacterium]|nr:prephenate dehydrogenase [Propionibacteriales bacterium]
MSTGEEPPSGPDLTGPVLVVGSGLIGASVGLALRRQRITVYLRDQDPQVSAVAASRGAGDDREPAEAPQLVVVCVPPTRVAEAVIEALHTWPRSVVTDVSSIKAGPFVEVVAGLGQDAEPLRRYVGGHPMAGRERSGPLAASGSLFDGRTWAVTPHEQVDPAAVAVVESLVRLCGANLLTMSPADHDTAVARISHLPHVLAVLAAARLEGAPPDQMVLSGQGLRDVTRVAAGDPGLWRQILRANASPVRDLLVQVKDDLDELIAQLEKTEPDVDGLLRRGATGTRAIPGKHGGPARSLDTLYVVVPDQPGELGRLFAAAGDAGVNIEDVRIDHDLGRPSGLLELAVPESAGPTLAAALSERGWVVHR